LRTKGFCTVTDNSKDGEHTYSQSDLHLEGAKHVRQKEHYHCNNEKAANVGTRGSIVAANDGQLDQIVDHHQGELQEHC
jgi:hypothetical protein